MRMTVEARRAAWTAASLLCAMCAMGLSWRSLGSPTWLYLPLRLFGVATIIIGYLAWYRPAWARSGHLLVALGATYYLQDLQYTPLDWLYPAGFCLAFLWTAVLAHLVLTWPQGRTQPGPIRALVAVCYLSAVGSQVVRFLVDRPAPRSDLAAPYAHTPAAKAASLLVTALTLVVVAVVTNRWLRASAVRRGWAAPVWTAVVIAGLLGTLPAIASVLELSIDVEHGLMLVALSGSVLLMPIIVLMRNVRLTRLRFRLTALVLDQDREVDLHTDPGLIQRELAEVLDDPFLRIAYPLDDGSHVDVDGRPFVPAPGRGTTTVHRNGVEIALLEHDEALRDVRAVGATTEAVVGLAIESARRHALLRAQVEQIHTSRLRMSTIAFEERHRIQRDLHDGAQQQLFAVLVLLDLAGRAPTHKETTNLVHQAHAQLKDSIASLRRLTQGIYPIALVEHGLAAAVEGLADVAPIPVTFTIPRRRWPRHIEATVFFTISEALANTYKHAQASHVRVDVEHEGSALRVDIADDGRGGADLTRLRALKDRVNTINGTLHIDSPPTRGTRITATIPLEAS